MVDEMVALGNEPAATAADATPPATDATSAQPLSDPLVVDDSLRGELVEQLA
jgi:hypothetical protein